MNKIIFMILLVMLSCSDQKKVDQQDKSGSIKDDLGNSFYFETAPQKIISLAPSITEILFELGLQSKLAGNTLYCDYPDEAKNITKIGDMLTVDYEKIIEIDPDLILLTVEGNKKNSYDKLKKLGYREFVTNQRNFEGIKKSTRDIASIFNIEPAAEKIINRWNQKIDSLKNENSRRDTLSALFLINAKPIFAAGKNTYINEIIEICALNNIIKDINQNYPVLNIESVIVRDPEIIIFSSNQYDIQSLKNLYPEWKNLKAFRNNRVYFVDENLFMRPGPRFVNAVARLNNLIYAE